MAFGEAGFENRIFPRIQAEADEHGDDPTLRERFGFLTLAGDAAREMVPSEASHEALEEYRDLLRQGRLPVVRGLALTRDDLVRRAVILGLMCQGQVLFETVEAAWLLDFRRYFASELEQLADLQQQGLVTVTDSAIEVTPAGWYFVRAVAMVFDRYLQANRNRARFSRIL
jgi:coproporphyrinogen III oxidase-like Fe-S oxidoreductase